MGAQSDKLVSEASFGELNPQEIKTAKSWICPEWTEIHGESINGSPASLFPSEDLIWGSKEHIAELNQYGLNLPTN